MSDRHTAEIEDLELDPFFLPPSSSSPLTAKNTTSRSGQRAPKKTPRVATYDFNTFSAASSPVKSRFSDAALTFAVVKQHFCWLTVPPCYSRCANQRGVFIWLVARYPPPHQKPHHGALPRALSAQTRRICTHLTLIFFFFFLPPKKDETILH